MTVVPLQKPDRVGRPGSPAPGSVEAGAGDLQFTNVGSRVRPGFGDQGVTVLTRASATSPLKLLNPRNAGASAWVYAATYGGGLVGGDSLSIRVEVGHRASALVATQASTKVYRSDRGATQRLHARVDDDSLLVLLPDPVTCFAGSRYTQEQHIDMQPSANLVLVDWLTAGRVGSGERWQFDAYQSQLRVWRGAHLVLHDGLSLLPADGDLPSRMDRFNCLATAVLLGPALKTTAARLAGSVGSAAVPRRADLLLSAAPLGEDGVLLRLAGVSVEQVGATLQQHLGIVSALLGDDPWACRW
jgi:urease accessory protein